MRKSELKIQAEACSFIWNEMPETRYCLYHVANEAQRSPVEWGMLKAAGFINGIQDIHFLWSGVTYRIEMKGEGGHIDPAQKVVHAAHAKQGSITYVFWDSDTLIRFVKEIVLGGFKIENWAQYVSEYSKPEMLDAYIKQFNDLKAKKRLK